MANQKFSLEASSDLVGEQRFFFLKEILYIFVISRETWIHLQSF